MPRLSCGATTRTDRGPGITPSTSGTVGVIGAVGGHVGGVGRGQGAGQLEGQVVDAPGPVAQPRPHSGRGVAVARGGHQAQAQRTGPREIDVFPGRRRAPRRAT